MKIYNGRVPACGVFCGGCPTYTRQKNPCLGAQLNSARCEKCKTFPNTRRGAIKNRRFRVRLK
jgi:putative acetyltransferase